MRGDFTRIETLYQSNLKQVLDYGLKGKRAVEAARAQTKNQVGEEQWRKHRRRQSNGWTLKAVD